MPKRKKQPQQEEEDGDEIQVGDAPTAINPYEVLSIPKDATPEQIRSAYRKSALKHHPDKASEENKQSAHLKFQEIALAYAVLSDPRRRQRYDTTGQTSESLDLDSSDDFDWTSFFRAQFSEVVSEAAIEQFASTYRSSDEERSHVLAAYTKHKGSMEKLYQEVMLSDMVVDEERFRGIIDAAIEAGEVEDHKKYSGESETARAKRIERARKRQEAEAKEAEKAVEEGEDEEEEAEGKGGDGKRKRKGNKKGGGEEGGGSLGDLAALIKKRQENRAEAFFDRLEAKYAAPPPAKKRKGKK